MFCSEEVSLFEIVDAFVIFSTTFSRSWLLCFEEYLTPVGVLYVLDRCTEHFLEFCH